VIEFPGRGQVHQAADLAGRDRDLSALRAFVYESSAQGGTMLLRGDPGVGKSALLDAAEEMAATAGMQVARAAGADFEDIGFSALNQLLLPLRGELGRLDEPQRGVLRAALGVSESLTPDLPMVSNAALALLCRAAAHRSLLLIVDDLHRVDRPSAMVLRFIGRCLSGSRVGLLAAERPDGSRVADHEAPGYEVRPLNEDASTRLVAERFPDLAPGVRRRIVTEALGNPLALLELPAGLSDLERSGRAALPAVLPLSRRLRQAFSTQVSALPAATRYLLLLAVLDGAGEVSLLGAAAPGQDVINDLVAAEQAGLARVDLATRCVVFSHPLIRSAIRELSWTADVRRGHLALAAQLADQPERRVWHLAEAAIEPDAEVASLLEQAARSMRDRGAVTKAVTALTRAAQLSPQHSDRGRLLAEAACLTTTGTGELSLGRRLLTEARRAAPEHEGAQGRDASLHAAVSDACLQLNGAEDIGTIHRQLVAAIGTGHGAPRDGDAPLVTALDTLLTVCAAGGRPELWEPFDAAVAGLGSDGCPELGLLAGTHGDPARSAIGILGELDAAISGLSGGTGHRRILAVGAAAARTDRLAGCREALRRVAREALEGGAVVQSTSALDLLCDDGFLSGGWNEAWQMAEDSLRASQSHGCSAQAWVARAHLAMIAAARGDDELMRELTDEIVRWAMPRGIALAQMAVHRARCLAALGRGDFEEAYRAAGAISPPGILASHVPDALWTVMDLVESAVRTGRPREARAHVAAARAARIAAISPRLAMLVTASAALAAPADQASGLFEQALDVRGASRWPFEFARVQLAFGEHLRRARANCEARGHLVSAHATFRALDARPWTDRAANELRAAKLTRTRTGYHRVAALTTQEQQIASLAAAGLTNRQIGQRLFLSPRTVGSHLYRVFPKLGVASRAGLRDALTAFTASDFSGTVQARSGSDPVSAGHG
jgi:DNA-binding CsgD family transcriptional regulator